MWIISWLGDERLASPEGMCAMELFIEFITHITPADHISFLNIKYIIYPQLDVNLPRG